jgi:tRNA-dihydrouridine synthase
MFKDLQSKLRNKFFLSSMMEKNNGDFCASRSKGCAMVQLGAYLAEPPAYGTAQYFLPKDRRECIRFLAEECRKAKTEVGVFTCLNLATPRLKWGIEAAECFFMAGGDLIELNIHGTYEPYFSLKKLRAMVLPENRSELFRWIKAFSNLKIPLIVKFRMGVIDDYSPVLKRLLDFNIFGIHFNIRDDKTLKPDFDFVQNVRMKDSHFLLVSGYVRSATHAKKLFEAGADVVGIAEPTISNPRYIQEIVNELKKYAT